MMQHRRGSLKPAVQRFILGQTCVEVISVCLLAFPSVVLLVNKMNPAGKKTYKSLKQKPLFRHVVLIPANLLVNGEYVGAFMQSVGWLEKNESQSSGAINKNSCI